MKIEKLTIGVANRAKQIDDELWLEYQSSVAANDRDYLGYTRWLALVVSECRQPTSVDDLQKEQKQNEKRIACMKYFWTTLMWIRSVATTVFKRATTSRRS